MNNPISSFPWIHGSANCAASTDPPLQTFPFDTDTFILRQSKCLNFEGPFLYLLFGTDRALLLDTGAQADSGEVTPVRQAVQGLTQQWLSARHRTRISLIVAHTHSHGDHTAGDEQFASQPDTTLVRPGLDEIKSFFGLPNWPEGSATLDLGNRPLTVFPLPGHERTHIAIYDENTRILLTGDTLYPGLLTVDDWPNYRQSAARLSRFAMDHEIAFVCGAHIEMKKAPRQMYPLPCTFQPDEHSLPLGKQHIVELDSACSAMGDNPHQDVHDDFIIQQPRNL